VKLSLSRGGQVNLMAQRGLVFDDESECSAFLGPTPNNVRVKAKRLAGQFAPRSVLDVIASLDDVLVRSKTADPVLPELVQRHDRDSAFWKGLACPQNPRDHQTR
jgi:hypothetical protein